ncbi:hypothetical protein NUITMVR1_02330 [Raoultella ornithinolytica]|jgi:hypothetical protein|nr:hypothetical protein NUITMVR1_02330 [Raoultella ornithinolytica]
MTTAGAGGAARVAVGWLSAMTGAGAVRPPASGSVAAGAGAAATAVAGAAKEAKDDQPAIPTATAQIKESFLFIALSSLLSHFWF